MANSKAGAGKTEMSVEHLLTRGVKEKLCKGIEQSNRAQEPACAGDSQ